MGGGCSPASGRICLQQSARVGNTHGGITCMKLVRKLDDKLSRRLHKSDSRLLGEIDQLPESRSKSACDRVWMGELSGGGSVLVREAIGGRAGPWEWAKGEVCGGRRSPTGVFSIVGG